MMNELKISKEKIFKSVALFVVGTFILSGTVLAASKSDKTGCSFRKDREAYHQKIDPDKAAQMISDTFGISKEKVAAYQAEGYKAKDLCMAALLAKAGGKSFESVISLKTKDNNWKEVGESLNITKEEIMVARQDVAAGRLSQVLKKDKEAMKQLMQQGYKPFDIVPAGILANRSGKSIENVLSLKQVNNTWTDVAGSLGVSSEDFKNDMRAISKEFGFGMHDKKPGDAKNKKRSADFSGKKMR